LGTKTFRFLEDDRVVERNMKNGIDYGSETRRKS
jgi:hypothetical protein